MNITVLCLENWILYWAWLHNTLQSDYAPGHLPQVFSEFFVPAKKQYTNITLDLHPKWHTPPARADYGKFTKQHLQGPVKSPKWLAATEKTTDILDL